MVAMRRAAGRPGNSVKPARSLSRDSDSGCEALARVNWLLTTSVISWPGAKARNGSTETASPATAPPASRPSRRGRHSRSRPSMPSGTRAQSLMAAAKPNATPPQASRGRSDPAAAGDLVGVASRGSACVAADLVAVEYRQRADQAEQVDPGLEQERMRRHQGVRHTGLGSASHGNAITGSQLITLRNEYGQAGASAPPGSPLKRRVMRELRYGNSFTINKYRPRSRMIPPHY